MLSIIDEEGRVLASFPLSARAGLNQFRWDLVLEAQERQSFEAVIAFDDGRIFRSRIVATLL